MGRTLDLDHVGAEPGQHLGAGRAGLVVGEVDDANALERLAHRYDPFCCLSRSKAKVASFYGAVHRLIDPQAAPPAAGA